MHSTSIHPAPALRAATVHAIERLADDVVMLQLRIAGDQAFSYAAGQFMAFHLPGGATRCYSMAGRPQPDAPLVFHIRLLPNGLFSGRLRQALSAPQSLPAELSISGPYGTCSWNTETAQTDSTILLGTGTGVAPLAALIEDALARGDVRPLTLYWGGRHPSDFYCQGYFERLAAQYPHFTYVPVLDADAPGWRGRRGFVQDCAASDFPRLGRASVFACGAPAMVNSARQTLISQCGLRSENFYADVFESAMAASSNAPVPPPVHVRLRQADGQMKSIALSTGTSLMSSLRELGLMQGICGGHHSCGSCRVEVDAAWEAALPAPGRAEARLLTALHAPVAADRLACQIIMTAALDGLAIAIPDKPL